MLVHLFGGLSRRYLAPRVASRLIRGVLFWINPFCGMNDVSRHSSTFHAFHCRIGGTIQLTARSWTMIDILLVNGCHEYGRIAPKNFSIARMFGEQVSEGVSRYL